MQSKNQPSVLNQLLFELILYMLKFTTDCLLSCFYSGALLISSARDLSIVRALLMNGVIEFLLNPAITLAVVGHTFAMYFAAECALFIFISFLANGFLFRRETHIPELKDFTYTPFLFCLTTIRGKIIETPILKYPLFFIAGSISVSVILLGLSHNVFFTQIFGGFLLGSAYLCYFPESAKRFALTLSEAVYTIVVMPLKKIVAFSANATYTVIIIHPGIIRIIKTRMADAVNIAIVSPFNKLMNLIGHFVETTIIPPFMQLKNFFYLSFTAITNALYNALYRTKIFIKPSIAPLYFMAITTPFKPTLRRKKDAFFNIRTAIESTHAHSLNHTFWLSIIRHPNLQNGLFAHGFTHAQHLLFSQLLLELGKASALDFKRFKTFPNAIENWLKHRFSSHTELIAQYSLVQCASDLVNAVAAMEYTFHPEPRADFYWNPRAEPSPYKTKNLSTSEITMYERLSKFQESNNSEEHTQFVEFCARRFLRALGRELKHHAPTTQKHL